jgi:hypothetical protein
VAEDVRVERTVAKATRKSVVVLRIVGLLDFFLFLFLLAGDFVGCYKNLLCM